MPVPDRCREQGTPAFPEDDLRWGCNAVDSIQNTCEGEVKDVSEGQIFPVFSTLCDGFRGGSRLIGFFRGSGTRR